MRQRFRQQSAKLGIYHVLTQLHRGWRVGRMKPPGLASRKRPENPRRSSVKIFSARAPLQRTRNDAFKAARCGPHTAGKLSARHFKHPCPIRGIRGSACNSCHSCPFVVKRNQLDGESRRTDRGMVGKEHARESSLKLVSGTGKSPKRAMNKIMERTVLNRKQNGVS